MKYPGNVCFQFAWFAIFGVAAPVSAEVKLNPLFSDGVVLQRGCEVPVRGTARDGEKITVEFGDQKLSTTADKGAWRVNLKPIAAGGPFSMKASGANQVTSDDLLVGEVWICSGQSNMQFGLAAAYPAAAAAYEEKLKAWEAEGGPGYEQKLAQ